MISKNKVIFKKKLRWANPANMVEFDVDVSYNIIKEGNTLEVLLDGT